MGTERNPLSIAISVDPENIQEGVSRIISFVRPEWDMSKVNFKVFTEGISNQLMGCFYPNEKGILVRVYGIGTELFIDRNAEQRTMRVLAKAGLGPDLIATFANGIVYHFVPGNVVTVENVTSCDLWPLVARLLGAMHQLPAEGSPTLWARLENFVNLLPLDLFRQDVFSNVTYPFHDLDSIRKEVEWLRGKLEATTSPIVFCHNDLLLANVVVNDERTSVTFIDYEYASTNYQAYDIANHFNEYAGVEVVDYSKLPPLSYQREWLREYLASYLGSPVNDVAVETLLGHVQQFMSASHLFWGLWSLVQAIHSKIDFDFAEYACIRLRKYTEIKSILDT